MGGLSPALGETGVDSGIFWATQPEALMSIRTERSTKDRCIMNTIYMDVRKESGYNIFGTLAIPIDILYGTVIFPK